MDKFTKLSKIGFSLVCFTSAAVKILLMGVRLGACHQFPGISLDPKSQVVWWVVRPLAHSPFGDNNLVYK